LIDHFALGGAETLLTQFAAAAPRAGISLSIACLDERDGNPAAAPLYERGTPPLNLGAHGRPGIRVLRAFRRLIAEQRPQIVHTHLGTSDIVGGVTARSLGVPMVSTIHAMDWSMTSRVYHAKRLLVRICAARVIAVSESARRSYLERGWASDGQIVTIHNGVDVTPATGSGPAVRAELGIDPDAFVLGMVSALRPEKAHDVAIDALALLRGRFPKLRLLIAGQGPSGEEIARRAAGLDGAVVLTGRRSDVMRVFDAVDVCLHPSRADAFPTTLIEAMAASVPVLATAVGGIPEIVSDRVTGVLIAAPPSAVALAQELAGLIEDSERRARLAASARRVYEERFTAEPWVQSTRSLYDEVLATQHRHSLRQLSRAATVTESTGGR